MNLPSTRTTSLVAAVALFCVGCASGPDDDFDPFQVTEETRSQQRDILDADPQVDRDRRAASRRSQRSRGDDDEMFVIPEAAAEPMRPVNARADGWDMSELRQFNGSDHVYRGYNRWDGPQDASFSAIVDSDDSHLYFWVEVTDDEVIDSSPTNPLDAVVIQLRDPRVDSLIDALPQSLQQRLDSDIESAFAITPDGRFAPGKGGSVPDGAVHTAGRTTDDGYIVEAAFSLEALSYLADIPLDRIAFRIDVYDADDRSARSPETRLSAIVDDGEPRFAATGTDGVLPAVSPDARPPRYDALGVWHRADSQWTFRPLEYISSRWHLIDDRQQAAGDIVDIDDLPDICHRSGTEKRVIDVYEHDGGNHRAMLAICGTAESGNRCPSRAESQLVWMALRADGERWDIEAAYEVFDEPLDQCPMATPGANPRVQDFSMVPFDRIDNQMWGIGYHRSTRRSGHRSSTASVRLIHPRAAGFTVLDRQLHHTTASGRDRVVEESRIFLTDLEDNGDMDVCTLRDIREQRCNSFNSGCQTRPRGHEVTVHVDLWDGDGYRFQDYPLTRHNNCRGSTSFEDIAPGFKIMLVGNRPGLLPTMR